MQSAASAGGIRPATGEEIPVLKKIALGLLVLVLAAAGYVATRPAQFSISRSRALTAPPEQVHAYVSDLRNWQDWSPWERLDPALQREYSGAESGPGASYAWSGNQDVGKGRMTITESEPGRSLTLRLEFLEPLTTTNTTRFEFEPSGSGTQATWSMSGERGFVEKAVAVVMDVEALIGPSFEEGLARLDGATAEAEPAPAPAPAPAPSAP
jgi:hypothetical protein